MTLLRGRLDGLEVTLGGRVLEEALAELEARLAEQPSFYRGSSAVVNFGDTTPTAADLARLRNVLEGAGVTMRALCGSAEELQAFAVADGLQYDPPATRLSDGARSLVADFAGARNDIAARRKRGESSVRRVKLDAERARPAELRLVEAPQGTLYHAATLRGGQTLHHTGNIVVVGDVNPGAELVATGDVLVFGRLAGIAHAGAGGDENARIYAVELLPTQLRIASFIGADEGLVQQNKSRPEVAVARNGKIAVLSLDELNKLESSGASSA
ncbi:MAG: septum site-determining protein MinC [Candidatus Eremiobacteraeota bacterium]|nr:septum site-determining protein MinC [Candidatus Eremiobacteraeota bacterium]